MSTTLISQPSTPSLDAGRHASPAKPTVTNAPGDKQQGEEHPELKRAESTGQQYLLLPFVCAWVALFVIETFVSSGPPKAFFASMNAGEAQPLTAQFWNLVKLILVWGWSNCLFLFLLAAMIGEAGQLCTGKKRGASALSDACVRGFFVYVSILAGQLATGSFDQSFAQTQYFRVATFGSVVAFAVGYHPTLFPALLARISAAIERRNRDPLQQQQTVAPNVPSPSERG